MRTLLLFSFVVVLGTGVSGQGQPAPRQGTPAQPAPRPAPAQPAPRPTPQPPATGAPATPRPAQPAPARRAQPASTRSGMAITVTDPQGATLSGIEVQVLGATERKGETNASGQVNFPGLQAGTYRLRFSGEPVITFEREVTLRGGQVADIDITLNPAPTRPAASAGAAAASPAPAAAPAAMSAAPTVGPAGEPQTLDVPDLLERNFVGTMPRRETLLSCSGNTRTTMLQLNMPLPERLYEAADAAYYVIGGEGSVRIAGRESKLATNAYVSIPRRTVHSFTRSGRRPLILLMVLSGEACEQPR